MAIRTTKEVLLDTRNDISKVIYFEKTEEFKGLANTLQGEIEVVAFKIRQYFLDGEKKVIIGEDAVMFRRSTWFSLFGNLSSNDFEASMNELMIQQIIYVNNKTWTGAEIQKVTYYPKYIKTLSDLEIVD